MIRSDRIATIRRLRVVVPLLLGMLGACSARVPANIDDACAIFDENRSWYRAGRKAEERWGVPIAVQLAIIRQESGFRPKARPPRRRILWIFPGPRPSTAYGYAQALDVTWEEYKMASGRRGADRDDFADAADFVSWYGARSARANGLGLSDAYALYLAYHEGDGGYRRGTYRRKRWLISTAEKVRGHAHRYSAQLGRCAHRFHRRWWWPF